MENYFITWEILRKTIVRSEKTVSGSALKTEQIQIGQEEAQTDF